jgi:hypothetical protein
MFTVREVKIEGQGWKIRIPINLINRTKIEGTNNNIVVSFDHDEIYSETESSDSEVDCNTPKYKGSNKIECECGASVVACYINDHKKTQKHLNDLQKKKSTAF